MTWSLPAWPPQPARRVLRVALMGAESTGKSTLLNALQQRLLAHGCAVIAVPETLRAWCEQRQRLPRAHEQASIAQQHVHAVLDANARLALQSTRPAVLLADTTPMSTALYSQLHFDDAQGLGAALAFDAAFDVRLLLGLDVAWQADGPWRDGAIIREQFDRLLREQWQTHGLSHHVIYGQGPARADAAWRSMQQQWSDQGPRLKTLKPWRAACDCCADPTCEWALFSGLGLGKQAAQD